MLSARFRKSSHATDLRELLVLSIVLMEHTSHVRPSVVFQSVIVQPQCVRAISRSPWLVRKSDFRLTTYTLLWEGRMRLKCGIGGVNQDLDHYHAKEDFWTCNSWATRICSIIYWREMGMLRNESRRYLRTSNLPAGRSWVCQVMYALLSMFIEKHRC